MERKINHKVGVKLFTKAQLENVLPTYENLFHKIDFCRKAAQEELNADEKRHYQYNFMYDNVFSILGKRGTGKTSVVFTLQKMIREEYGKKNSDVVLPLIIPEVIPENCTVLGWILAIVREEVKKLESRLEIHEKSQGEELFWNKCRYMEGKRIEDRLEVKLDRLSQLFYAGNYNPANEGSYYKAVDNSVLQAMDYYKFAQGIADFWDAWIAEIRELHRLEGYEEDICPLIYFIFDDVDLAPEKIDELLSVIIKYLSHPNIIVLTTADEELFLEVIEKRLDKNIGRLPGEVRDYLLNVQNTKYIMWPSGREEKEEDRRQGDIVGRTTRMYLGKVLPTSTRYYLRLFNTAKQKEVFCLDDGLSLGMGVVKQVQRLTSYIECDKFSNFMGTEDTGVNFYLNFMGNTSRQIGNVYIALKELIDNLIMAVREGKKKSINSKNGRQAVLQAIYQNCRYFLCIAIRANHELTEVIEQVDEFVDEIFLPEYNQWKMYYNYAYLNEFLGKSLKEESRQRKIEISLQLYALLAFQESLLLILEEGIPEGITGREKIHAVNFLTEYVEKIAFKERHVFRDDLEPHIFFQHYVNLLDRLPVIVANDMTDQKFNMEYFYDLTTYQYDSNIGLEELLEMRNNSGKWFEELAGRLSMVYGNVYLFDKQDMSVCVIYPNTTCLTGYQVGINAAIRSNIEDCFGLMEMQTVWNPEDIDTAINCSSDSDISFYELVKKVENYFRQNGKSVVRLREIVAYVIDMVKKGSENFKDSNCFTFCSKEILHDMIVNRDQLGERATKRSLIQEYALKIRRAGNMLGMKGILFDVDNVTAKLKQVMEIGQPWNEQITDIMNELRNGENLENGEMVIPKKTYFEIVRVFSNVVESGVRLDDGLFDDNHSLQEVREILANMDIGVSLEEQELRPAVELGLKVLVIEFLQRAYIYQTIHERYESGNSMSSRSLERVTRQGQETDTYYYLLFKLMVGLTSPQSGEEKLPKSTDTQITAREIESIRDDVVAACRRERQRYVDLLIQGVKDE